jgi:hypothetical protein
MRSHELSEASTGALSRCLTLFRTTHMYTRGRQVHAHAHGEHTHAHHARPYMVTEHRPTRRLRRVATQTWCWLPSCRRGWSTKGFTPSGGRTVRHRSHWVEVSEARMSRGTTGPATRRVAAGPVVSKLTETQLFPSTA